MKRAPLAGKVRIMVGVKLEYKAVSPVGQEQVKQSIGQFPTDKSGLQLRLLSSTMQPCSVSRVTPGAIRALF